MKKLPCITDEQATLERIKKMLDEGYRISIAGSLEWGMYAYREGEKYAVSTNPIRVFATLEELAVYAAFAECQYLPHDISWIPDMTGILERGVQEQAQRLSTYEQP